MHLAAGKRQRVQIALEDWTVAVFDVMAGQRRAEAGIFETSPEISVSDPYSVTGVQNIAALPAV